MKSVKQLMNTSINDETGRFIWGIDTVMKSLRPNCLYEMTMSGGRFTVTHWADNWDDEKQQYIEKPTEEEIKNEYLRQQTISEVVDYYIVKERNKQAI